MKKVSVTLKGISTIGFSAPITSIKPKGEGHDAFEARTWNERVRKDGQGYIYHPSISLKNCLAEIAKFLGETVPGKGKSTYTKHFEAGVIPGDDLQFGVKHSDVVKVSVFVPSDGKRGGGSRVWKHFPTLPAGWEADTNFYLIDPILVDKLDVVEEYLKMAGNLIGLGCHRPRNNGSWGRFQVKDFVVEDYRI